ncbi:MAG: hypothetical protein ALAOOOJD_00493 [bacterium]|nr:hypothetical protein [bacterium]
MLLLLACNNDKTIPLSGDLADPSQLGRRLQATQTIGIDSTANRIANTFGTIYLWLGKYDNVETRILLRFAKLNLPDTVTVVAGTLKFRGSLVQGQGADFEATIHEVTGTWDSSKVTWPDAINLFNPTPMDRQQVKTEKADSVTFTLDPAVVSSWNTAEGWKKGVLLQAPNATFMKAFHSHFRTPLQPTLELVTLKRSSTKNDTTRLSPIASVFVFNRLNVLPQGPLYVGLGEQHQSTLFFDISAIPTNATISRAFLTLEADTLNSAFYSNRIDLELARASVNFGLNPLQFDPARLSSDSLSIVDIDSINATMPKITFSVRSTVQLWVANSQTNLGLVLLPSSFTGRDVTRVAFYSRETDAARAPKLQIEYTLPPQ